MNHRESGLQLYSQGDWLTALASFERSLSEQPLDLISLRGMASCRLQLGCPELALEQYRRAFELDSEDAETSYGLALTMVVMGRYSQALPYLEHSLQRQPGNFRAWSKKGLVHLQLSQYPEAEACLCKALERNPYDPLDWSNLGVAYLAQNKLDRARPCFYRVLQLDPSFAPARGYLERLSRAMEWSFDVHSGVFRWNGHELAPYRSCDLPAGTYDLEADLELRLEKCGDLVQRLHLHPRNGHPVEDLIARLLGDDRPGESGDVLWWGRIHHHPDAVELSFGTLQLAAVWELSEPASKLAYRAGEWRALVRGQVLGPEGPVHGLQGFEGLPEELIQVECGPHGVALGRGEHLVCSQLHGSLEVPTPSTITALLGGPNRLVSGHQDGFVRHWSLPLNETSEPVFEECLKPMSSVCALLSHESPDRGGLVAVTGDGTCYLPRGQRFQLPPGKPCAAALHPLPQGVAMSVAVELPDGRGRIYELRHTFG